MCPWGLIIYSSNHPHLCVLLCVCYCAVLDLYKATDILKCICRTDYTISTCNHAAPCHDTYISVAVKNLITSGGDRVFFKLNWMPFNWTSKCNQLAMNFKMFYPLHSQRPDRPIRMHILCEFSDYDVSKNSDGFIVLWPVLMTADLKHTATLHLQFIIIMHIFQQITVKHLFNCVLIVFWM